MHRNCHRNSYLIHCFYFNLKVFIQIPTPSHGNSIITYTYKREEWKRTKVTKWLPPVPAFWYFLTPHPQSWSMLYPLFQWPQEAALEANRLLGCWSTVTSFSLKDSPKFWLEAALAYKISMAAAEGIPNPPCTNGFRASILLSLNSWQMPHRAMPKVCLVQHCISKSSQRWVSGIPQLCQFL